jgi:hypothetical protein
MPPLIECDLVSSRYDAAHAAQFLFRRTREALPPSLDYTTSPARSAQIEQLKLPVKALTRNPIYRISVGIASENHSSFSICQ